MFPDASKLVDSRNSEVPNLTQLVSVFSWNFADFDFEIMILIEISH